MTPLGISESESYGGPGGKDCCPPIDVGRPDCFLLLSPKTSGLIRERPTLQRPMRCVAVIAAVLGVALCQTPAGADCVAALLVGGVALAVLLAALGFLFGALHTLMCLLMRGPR